MKVNIYVLIFMGNPVCNYTLFTVIPSTFTHTVPSKSVTDEAGWTGAGLSTEWAEASWTTGWKTQGTYHTHALDTCSKY